MQYFWKKCNWGEQERFMYARQAHSVCYPWLIIAGYHKAKVHLIFIPLLKRLLLNKRSSIKSAEQAIKREAIQLPKKGSLEREVQFIDPSETK